MNPTLLDKFFTETADTAGPEPSPVRTVTEDHVYLLAGTPFEQYRDFLLKELPDSDPGRIQRIAGDWRAASLYLLQIGRAHV